MHRINDISFLVLGGILAVLFTADCVDMARRTYPKDMRRRNHHTAHTGLIRRDQLSDMSRSGHMNDMVRNPTDMVRNQLKPRKIPEPTFYAKAANVTVSEGEVAVLPCRVRHLGDRAVVWNRAEPFNVLTHVDRRIIDDIRISVERPTTPAWNLHIREAEHNDTGRYMCQINTNPVTEKFVFLTVIVPPKFDNEKSSDLVKVKEGETAELHCRAEGKPEPWIEWRRLTENDKGEKSQSKLCPDSNKVGSDGEVLLIRNISRQCGDIYQCVAMNSRGDTVSRSIPVEVQFPPEVSVRSPRLGQEIGKETALDCNIIASPPIVKAFWKKDGKIFNKLTKSDAGKTRIDTFNDGRYTQTLSLRLLMIRKEDFGVYTCEGENLLGKATANMTLYDYQLHRQAQLITTTPTPTTVSRTGNSHSYDMHAPHRYNNNNYGQGGGRSKHVVKDGRYTYPKARPKYDQISPVRGHSRGKGSSEKDGSSRLDVTCGQYAVQVAALWLTFLCLRL